MSRLEPPPPIRWTPTPLGRAACAAQALPRVAVIGKRNHLHFDEHVSEAFVDAGHEVRHYQFNQRPLAHGLLRAGLRAVARRRGTQLGDAWHARAVAQELARFRPQLVFFVSVFFIPRVYLEAARSLNPPVTIVGWDGDALARFEGAKSYAGLLDLLGVTEGAMAPNAAAVFGRALYLPYAVNPRIYRDRQLARQPRAYFCGAHTGDRQAIVSSLDAVAMTIRGPGWERFTPQSRQLLVRSGKVSMGEQAQDYATHLAVWNQHQKENNPHGSLNMRDFEATASGALLVSDHREHMHEHFHVGDEVLTYTEHGELCELLAGCIANPAGSRHKAARAASRALAENTYRHRVQSVLAAL